MADAQQADKGVKVPLWAMEACKGDARNAMVYAQIKWWFQPAWEDGSPRTVHLHERDGETWMYQTDAEMSKETGLSSDQVHRARLALVKLGLIVCQSAKHEGRKVTLVRPVNTGNRGSAESSNGVVPVEEQERLEIADPRHSGNRGSATLRARAVPSKEVSREERTIASDDAGPSVALVHSRATDDPLTQRAHLLAKLAFEQTPRPITKFPAVMERLEEALRAGHAVQALETVICAGPVVWTREGLSTALVIAKRNARSSGPSLDDRVEANRRLAREVLG